MSTFGWVRKSNFDEESQQAAHAALAQWLADTGISNDINFTSVWFMGLLNWIADPLSRKFKYTDEVLTQRLLEKYPEQVPSTFKISPLPKEISSALLYLVQTEKPELQSLPKLTAMVTPLGEDGVNSSFSVESKVTGSLKDSQPTTESECSKPLPNASESATGPSPLKDLTTWLAVHANPPLTALQRPSLPPADLIQEPVVMDLLTQFYSVSGEDTRTMTQQKSPKKQFRIHC